MSCWLLLSRRRNFDSDIHFSTMRIAAEKSSMRCDMDVLRTAEINSLRRV
jgi:hypothetical protein